MITRQTIIDGIYGLAVADALGVPFEFRKRASISKSPCVGMVGFGTHEKPAGTWSDDTSMTLALADGLAAGERPDYSAIMDRFVAWYDCGEYTVDGLFDVGGGCAMALNRYTIGVKPIECGGRGEWDNGNGSLMRILPAVLYSIKVFGGVDEKFISDMSSLTHGHATSCAACNIYAKVVQSILCGENLRESVMTATQTVGDGRSEFDRLKSANFFRLTENEIKSSGYVVDTLEAALWCLHGTDTYADCVLRAVNLGDDTDTVAAVAGSLAGLRYGIDDVPRNWLNTLRGKDIIDGVISRFADSLSV